MKLPAFEIVDKPLLISPFGAWRNGNEDVRVQPPSTPPSSKPYVIAIWGEGYRFGQVLVFATSHEHAVKRVWSALNECAAIQREYRTVRGFESPGDPRRVLGGVERGELKVYVYEHNINDVVLAGPWASNDGLCY